MSPTIAITASGRCKRLPLTDEFLARRPVALLDRDGVLNRKPPRAEYVRNWDEFEWLPGAKTALAQLKSAGYRLIVISNQAGVARGAMTAADLEAVNRRMMAEAAEEGGEIDAIYTCMHGWEEGCECRKPRAGLLFQAQREFSFDLTRAVFIGDDERDAAAADAAGCGFLRASERTGLHELTENLLGVRGRQLSCDTATESTDDGPHRLYRLGDGPGLSQGGPRGGRHGHRLLRAVQAVRRRRFDSVDPARHSRSRAQDLEGFDAVVHLAALSNDPLGDLNERWTDEINNGGSVRLAQSGESGRRARLHVLFVVHHVRRLVSSPW